MENIEVLRGKTVVITGASSGAGRMAALEFAKHKVSLVLAGRNKSALQDVASAVKEAGSESLVVVTDVSDAKAVTCLAREANDWKGRIDIWINNAGVLAAGEFEKTPIEVHHQVIATNLLGYINGAHAVLPYFKKQAAGILINNISIGGYLPVPYGVGYTASKFGLRGFSEALRGELTDWADIHVCDLFPAFLKTPGIQHAANFTGKLLRPAPPVYDPLVVAHAMVRMAENPKTAAYPGAAAILLKSAHAILPETMTKMTGFVMRKYFNAADEAADTEGNVFKTVNEHMATHQTSKSMQRSWQKWLAVALIGGGAVLLARLGGERLKTV
jgi:short-subunit dehydrogenase